MPSRRPAVAPSKSCPYPAVQACRLCVEPHLSRSARREPCRSKTFLLPENARDNKLTAEIGKRPLSLSPALRLRTPFEG